MWQGRKRCVSFTSLLCSYAYTVILATIPQLRQVVQPSDNIMCLTQSERDKSIRLYTDLFSAHKVCYEWGRVDYGGRSLVPKSLGTRLGGRELWSWFKLWQLYTCGRKNSTDMARTLIKVRTSGSGVYTHMELPHQTREPSLIFNLSLLLI